MSKKERCVEILKIREYNIYSGDDMRQFRPSYYDKFKCISKKCKHNCCIGWEIDIDEDSLENYVNHAGPFGKRLQENISLIGDCPHFILKDNDRCPFLNSDNLCDIIINMGEEHLCQICNDHPRFINEYSDREEIGLGLCCEEAARIILGEKEKVSPVGERKGDEERIFLLRDMVIEMLQNREQSIDKRIEAVLKTFKIKLPKRDWIQVYKNLERLDDKWTDRLNRLTGDYGGLTEDWSIPFEQILVYFIYRYMAKGVEDKRYNERILFGVLSFYIIREVFRHSSENMETLVDICRMYSSEIEYSEENVEMLLELLKSEE